MRKKLYPAVAISFAAASPRNLFGAISCKWNQRRMESAAMLASSNSHFPNLFRERLRHEGLSPSTL